MEMLAAGSVFHSLCAGLFESGLDTYLWDLVSLLKQNFRPQYICIMCTPWHLAVDVPKTVTDVVTLDVWHRVR